MIPVPRRRVLLSAVFGVLALMCASVEAQVILYSEPTVCATPFKPISGITFHAGAQWDVTWHAPRGQFGSAVFAGYPIPA